MYYNISESGQRIKELRLSRGLTQEQLADILSVSRNHLTVIEIGRKGASVDLLIRLSDFFGVSIDYIVLGTKDDPTRNDFLKIRIKQIISELNSFVDEL